MTVNKNIAYAILVVLAISLVANYYFYSNGNETTGELERSKGRVEILMKESLAHSIKMDSLKHLIDADTIAINNTIQGEKKKIKIIYYEKNRIANLPLDSAIIFFAKRHSSKKGHN